MRSQLFKFHQAIGDPIPTIKRLSDWLSDELMLINIGTSTKMDSRRTDKWHNLGSCQFFDLVAKTSKHCFCPLTVGGRIREISDFDKLFQAGADKCVVNTILYENPDLVIKAAKKYGSQAVVASLDIKKDKKSGKNFRIYKQRDDKY